MPPYSVRVACVDRWYGYCLFNWVLLFHSWADGIGFYSPSRRIHHLVEFCLNSSVRLFSKRMELGGLKGEGGGICLALLPQQGADY